jgi:hypothetical protein
MKDAHAKSSTKKGEAAERNEGGVVHTTPNQKKKAHWTVLAVHRGGGASIEYLQGKDKFRLSLNGGNTYPTVSP